ELPDDILSEVAKNLDIMSVRNLILTCKVGVASNKALLAKAELEKYLKKIEAYIKEKVKIDGIEYDTKDLSCQQKITAFSSLDNHIDPWFLFFWFYDLNKLIELDEHKSTDKYLDFLNVFAVAGGNIDARGDLKKRWDYYGKPHIRPGRRPSIPSYACGNGRTALMVAAHLKCTKVLTQLIKLGASVNAVDEMGRTALMDAALANRIGALTLLIEAKANIQATDIKGKNALILAAEEGNSNVVKFLIEKGVDVNAVDKMGYTALIWAAMNGKIDTVKFLIEEGIDANVVDEMGCTALLFAAMNGNIEIVKLLFERCVDVNAVNEVLCTALIWAATKCERSRSSIATMNFLIDKGADVNAVDEMGRTALIIASEIEDTDIVKFLIDKGADVNAVSEDGRSALTIFTAQNNTEAVKLLIEKGAKTVKRTTVLTVEKTTLIACVRRGDIDSVRCFLKEGADVNAADEMGHTALILAAFMGHTRIVELLISVGADVNAKDKCSNTALMMFAMCCKEGRDCTIARRLILAGADVSAKQEFGSAMEFALAGGNKDLIEMLLRPNRDAS
ncbi:MAG: ankyrin repeat domain-containing protein, partial [Bdellovibrionota bacterium]